MNLTEKKLDRTDIYDGKIIKVHVDSVELPNGETSKREVVDHPGGVCIAALTDQKELLFVRQFRYPYSEVIWELPAGKLEPGASGRNRRFRRRVYLPGKTLSFSRLLRGNYPSLFLPGERYGSL